MGWPRRLFRNLNPLTLNSLKGHPELVANPLILNLLKDGNGIRKGRMGRDDGGPSFNKFRMSGWCGCRRPFQLKRGKDAAILCYNICRRAEQFPKGAAL